MDALKPTYQIINTIQGSAADLVVNDKFLLIGPTANRSPKINLSQNCYLSRIYSLVEKSQRYTYTPGTLAANIDYGFVITQTINGQSRNVAVIYNSGATAPGSAQVVCDALRAVLLKYNNSGKVNVVGTGTSTCIVTGGTGNPLFSMGGPLGGTFAETLDTIALNATPGTAIAHSSGVITVTTLAAHNLSTGALVGITSATGFTFTKNGNASVATLTPSRIHVTGATTFTITGVVGSGTNTGTAVLTVYPSEVAGSYELVAAEVEGNGATLSPNTGRKYTKYVIEYANPVSSLNSISRYQEGSHILFVDDTFDDTTPTEFAALEVRFTEIFGGLAAGGAAADAELLANQTINN